MGTKDGSVLISNKREKLYLNQCYFAELCQRSIYDSVIKNGAMPHVFVLNATPLTVFPFAPIRELCS